MNQSLNDHIDQEKKQSQDKGLRVNNPCLKDPKHLNNKQTKRHLKTVIKKRFYVRKLKS